MEQKRDVWGEKNRPGVLFREPDSRLPPEALLLISSVLQVPVQQIRDIEVLKEGMTNRSFRFTAAGSRYILRVPGAGTNQLINREQEAEVYRTISGLGLCDDPVYLDPGKGYKITRYLEGVRACRAECISDVTRAMDTLVAFHKMHLQVAHSFELFQQILFYESLRGKASVYADYARTKEEVFSLRPYIEKTRTDWCLTHIDAVPDNFLFTPADRGEKLQLTDWEYAGMQDPHVDIAMFGIYSLYNKKQIDRLTEIYFAAAGETCTPCVRAKIYAYVAVCGLLWSNWCEVKASLGVQFGQYSRRQYGYAKEFTRYAREEISRGQKVCIQ